MITLLLVLAGCLPQGALGRGDALEADRYRFHVSIETTTAGLDVPPFVWHVEGTLLSSFSRGFRDGSLGRLVRFEDVQARVERSGIRTDVPRPGLDGAWLELRAFPAGQILTVGPLAPWTGRDGHLELLDFLWPALSPSAPALRVGASAPAEASWPIAVAGLPPARARTSTRWTLLDRTGGAGHLSYTGELTISGGPMTARGEVSGEVHIDGGAARVVSHALRWRRVVRTVWPGERVVSQSQSIVVDLRLEGTAPAPAIDNPPQPDDPAADARPLRLADGREPSPAPLDPSAVLPFLLLPDDATPGEWDGLRRQAGMMSVED